MFGIIRAERAPALKGKLLAVYGKIPPDSVALMNVSNPLMRVQRVQRSRRAVLGEIAGGGQGYHSHVGYSLGNRSRV